MSDIAFTPESEDNVIDLLGETVKRNTQLVAQLKLLGRAPSPQLFVQTAVETIIDLLFGDDEETLRQYHTAVEVAINSKLQHEVEVLLHEVRAAQGDEDA